MGSVDRQLGMLWPLGQLPAVTIGGVLTTGTRIGSRAFGLSVPAPDEPR